MLILDRDGKFYSYFSSLAKKKIRTISVGYHRKANIRVIRSKSYPQYEKILIKSLNKQYSSNLKNHHIKNILFAIAVLEILNLNFEKIKNKLNELDILKEGKIIKVKHKNVNFNLIDGLQRKSIINERVD